MRPLSTHSSLVPPGLNALVRPAGERLESMNNGDGRNLVLGRDISEQDIHGVSFFGRHACHVSHGSPLWVGRRGLAKTDLALQAWVIDPGARLWGPRTLHPLNAPEAGQGLLRTTAARGVSDLRPQARAN